MLEHFIPHILRISDFTETGSRSAEGCVIYCARDVGNAVESPDYRFTQLKPLALGWISILVPAVHIPYDF